MELAHTVEAALRVPLIMLWNLFLIRATLYSWQITEQPAAVRERSWQMFRPAMVIMAIAIAYLYSPPPLLMAAGLIDAQLALWMVNAGSVLNLAAVIMLLAALDTANNIQGRTVFTYAAIAFAGLAAGAMV